MNEIILLDKVRNAVKLFSDNDERCVYEFIKQVDPLKNLMENEAYTVLTEELLTKDVQRAMPDYVPDWRCLHYEKQRRRINKRSEQMVVKSNRF